MRGVFKNKIGHFPEGFVEVISNVSQSKIKKATSATAYTPIASAVAIYDYEVCFLCKMK